MDEPKRATARFGTTRPHPVLVRRGVGRPDDLAAPVRPRPGPATEGAWRTAPHHRRAVQPLRPSRLPQSRWRDGNAIEPSWPQARSDGGGVATMTCVLLAFLGQTAVRHPELLGNFAGFPQFDSANANAIDAAHYDDQRDPLRGRVVPFIQGAEIDGNYVRLTVPYRPDDDAAAVRKHCPATEAEGDGRAIALLHCLGTLHPVTLDGKPIADLRYAAGSDPRTDRPVLVAMIDVRKLLPGRHELAVARPPSPADKGNAAPPWIIPFWH